MSRRPDDPPARLLDRFYRLKQAPSDIQLHLDTLRELAWTCTSVIELGTRWGVSTTALLCGQPLRLVTVDCAAECTEHVQRVLGPVAGRTRFQALTADSRSCEPFFRPDLLFVDTLHTASQLRAELDQHGRFVRRYLVFHDTVTFGETGEDGGPGIMGPIRDLLQEGEWVQRAHYRVNNGLLVLARA